MAHDNTSRCILRLALAGSLAFGSLCSSAAQQHDASISQQAPRTESSSLAYRYHHLRVVAGGFITGILFHPQVDGLAYVRTDIGGAYRWDKVANKWVSLSEWISAKDDNLLGVESMAIDPLHPDRLYLAVGTYTQPNVPNGAILRSQNRGQTFDRIDLPFQMGGNEPGRFAGERLVVDPANSQHLFLGTRKNGLWTSNDTGSTWSQVSSFPSIGTDGIGIAFVVFAPKNAQGQQDIYAGVSQTSESLFVSHDGGNTWVSVQGAPRGLRPYHAAFQTDGTLYLTYGNQPGPNDVTHGAVWKRSADGQWKEISPLTQPTNEPGWGYAALTLDPKQPKTLMVSTLDHWHPGDSLFRTTDGGEHWIDLGPLAQRDASESPWLRTESGQLYFGHWIGAAAIDPFHPHHVLYGTGETLWSSQDIQHADQNKSTHWKVDGVGIEETAVISLLSPPAGAPLFVGLGDIGCFRADTVRANQQAKELGPPRLSNCDSIATAYQQPALMAMIGRTWGNPHHGGFSVDAGMHWQPFASEPEGASDGGIVAVSADGSSIVWSTTHGLYATQNHGTSWSLLACGHILPIVADPTQRATYYVLDVTKHTLRRFVLTHVDTSASCPTDEAQTPFQTLPASVPEGSHLLNNALDPKALWLYGEQGVTRIEYPSGAAMTLPHATHVAAFALGKSAPGSNLPTLYLSGAVDGVDGLFRSTDQGHTWKRIDDPLHQYGIVAPLAADANTFGLVYLGTNGLGVIVGEEAR